MKTRNFCFTIFDDVYIKNVLSHLGLGNTKLDLGAHV